MRQFRKRLKVLEHGQKPDNENHRDYSDKFGRQFDAAFEKVTAGDFGKDGANLQAAIDLTHTLNEAYRTGGPMP